VNGGLELASFVTYTLLLERINEAFDLMHIELHRRLGLGPGHFRLTP
jgi:hypothetical protein